MKRLYLLLIPALLLCTPSVAQERSGTVTNYLNHFFGLKPNGAPNPSANKLCEDKFHDYMGDATNNYKINPKTLIMSDETTFHGKTYKLHPLGLAGRYAFGFFQRPANPIYAVLFTISTDFNTSNNKINLVLNRSVSCVLTNLDKL
jgi:hypothetical protein